MPANLASVEIPAFDTHDFVKRLAGAGMPEPQAEILAGEYAYLINERLATKSDLEAMGALAKRDLDAMEAATKREFKAMEAANKRDLEALENRLVIKLGSLFFFGIAALATLITIL